MADLDDFFAKRDKKKKKIGKFEADNIAKILEKKRLEADKSQQQQPEVIESPPEPKVVDEDDEWREAVEEKPDFSGLRIEELVLDDEDENENDEGIEEDVNKEGPWKSIQKHDTIQNTNESNERPIIAPKSDSTKDIDVTERSSVAGDDDDSKSEASSKDDIQTTPTVAPPKGAYIPPAMRKRAEEAKAEAATIVREREPKPSNPSSGGGGAYVPPFMRKNPTNSSSGIPTRPKKALPNINDTEVFPTLGS